MAYTKHEWKQRIGSGLNKFKDTISNKVMILVNQPDEITQEGTPIRVDWLNEIEEGIYTAHEEKLGKNDDAKNSLKLGDHKPEYYATAKSMVSLKSFVEEEIKKMGAEKLIWHTVGYSYDSMYLNNGHFEIAKNSNGRIFFRGYANCKQKYGSSRFGSITLTIPTEVTISSPCQLVGDGAFEWETTFKKVIWGVPVNSSYKFKVFNTEWQDEPDE